MQFVRVGYTLTNFHNPNVLNMFIRILPKTDYLKERKIIFSAGKCCENLKEK